MGFSNTTYRDTINNLVSSQQERLSNPYYKFIDRKPTVVTYWNLNDKKTTLDEGTRNSYAQLGSKSSLRYNKVNNFVLYGLPTFPVNMQLSEYGIESNPIEAEALILPKTIIPFNDDYFIIPYLKNPYIFRVNNVTIDTLENGSNFYIIQCHLDNTIDDYKEFLNSINFVKTFNFKIENIGTNKTPILTDTDSEIITVLEEIYNTFRNYYIDLFYRPNIQTFVYGYLDMYIYDPYIIEFIIRNNLFSLEDDKYMYIYQAVHKPSTFSIEYDKTIFRNIENRNSQLYTNSCYPVPVHDPNSLLMCRMEDYHELSINLHHSHNDPINWLQNKLFDRIVENHIYNEEDEKDPKLYRNIIINFMNINDNFIINDLQINSLLNIELKYCKDLFYEIPILMYIIQWYINKLQTSSITNHIEENAFKYLEDCFCVGK